MRDKLAENSKKAVLIPRVSGMMFSFTDNKRSVFKCRQTHLNNSLKNLQVVGGGRAHYFNSEISKELHIAIRFFKNRTVFKLPCSSHGPGMFGELLRERL